ncbi:MAG: antitoxin [Coriobacteriales bacterium]|jgi:hypothetical protein|nr:antitoxin [Coriobacteriales bacterium]
MPQLSLYLDAQTMKLVEKNAKLEQSSLSKYVASLIKDRNAQHWPSGFWDLYGSIDDDSFVAPSVPAGTPPVKSAATTEVR